MEAPGNRAVESFAGEIELRYADLGVERSHR